jgi:Prokaryotic RING finger family 1
MEKDAAKGQLTQAPRCPVCGEGLSQSTVVLCRACSSPHHRKCWGFNKGCAVFGCGCRTFSQPAGAGDDIEFSTRGIPNLVGLMFLIPGFMVGLFTAIALLPKGMVDMVVGLMTTLFVPTILGITLGPLLTESRYKLSAQDRMIYKQLVFGQLELGASRPWKSFQEVEELELKVGQQFPQQGPQMPQRSLQVVLRDRQGRSHMIENIFWADRETVLGKVEAAAELLDTVVSLPAELAGGQKLPPGLGQAIRALPREEGTEALPPGEGADPGPDR